MRIGVPRETAAGERRVALVPEVVGKLVPAGFEVLVERGAGEAASFPDAAYEEAGARLVDDVYGDAEAVVKVQKPTADEAGRLREGQVLIGFLQPLTDPRGNRAARASAASSRSRWSRSRASRARSRWTRSRRRRPSPATRPRCSRPSGCRSSSRC